MDNDIATFVRVVERGTFRAAAEDVGLTPSAVSKLVTRLEGRLGTRLLYRTTRRLALTPEGEVFFKRAREIVDAIDEAMSEVAQADKPRGMLRINCAVGFGYHELSRVLPDFVARYPDIDVVLAVTDRVVDLLAENSDVGIRSGVVTDQSLVARKFAVLERRLYAAPDYLKLKGTPQSPDELAEHNCIVLGTHPPYTWPFRIDTVERKIDIKSRLVVNNAEAAYRLALAGGGITRIADVLVGNAVRNRSLVPVLDAFNDPEPTPLSAVYPYGRFRSSRVRVFVDYLIERFSKTPWKYDAA